MTTFISLSSWRSQVILSNHGSAAKFKMTADVESLRYYQATAESRWEDEKREVRTERNKPEATVKKSVNRRQEEDHAGSTRR